MRVLVTGATGFVGSNLVPALQAAGHDIVAMTRDATTYDPPDGVDVVEGDLLEPETLAGDFDDIDAAYYLVHSLQTGKDFEERDREAATNFSAAASAGGVERVVYLGGLGETGDDLSPHLRSRQEVEQLLARGSYDLTTLRAAIIVGAGSVSFQMVVQLVNKLPLMIAPKWLYTDCQPIAISDVVQYLVGVLEAPEAAGQTYQIGGPDVLTYKEMLLRTAAAMGKQRLVIPVPVLTPNLSAYWVDLVTDIPRSISHPLISGLKNPVVVTDDSIDAIVPVDRTPFETAVARALAEAES
jgi:uncharacterized protein YbjT (DUF2867 family)